MNRNVRRITDGAMMTAIVGVLLMINRQMGGFFEEFILFMFPLPLVFYSVKYGMKASWLVLVSVSILGFILGSPAMMFYAATESLIGMIYGDRVRKKKDSRSTLFITVALSVVLNVLTMLVFASMFGYDMNAEMTEYQSMMNQLFERTGTAVPPNVDLASMLKTMLIVSVLITGVIQGIVTHLLARVVLRRMRVDIPPATPLTQFFPPVWSGYIGIAGLVAYYYSILRPLPDSMAQGLLQGFGLCGTMYLLVFGMIAIIVVGKLMFPRTRLLIGIFAFFMAMSMMIATTVMGFLYITTSWHSRLLEGVNNAAKNEES